jgi:Zn ribbon nucleic-acid-binding protein
VEPVRCPYCIQGNGFKPMTPVLDHLECLKCGHKSLQIAPATSAVVLSAVISIDFSGRPENGGQINWTD